jgi:hypothetical protein
MKTGGENEFNHDQKTIAYNPELAITPSAAGLRLKLRQEREKEKARTPHPSLRAMFFAFSRFEQLPTDHDARICGIHALQPSSM